MNLKFFLGFCIDLLNFLSELIDDFNYEIFITNKYGVKQPDGSWDGLLGYLLRNEADVSVASLTINQVRYGLSKILFFLLNFSNKLKK